MSDLEQELKNMRFETHWVQPPANKNIQVVLSDKDVTKILKAVGQYALGVVGENEKEFNTPQPELASMVRNRFREELRTAFKQLEQDNE